MFNCIKSFSYKMNISANQVSNALRMKALGNTKPDTPKIAGNFLWTNSQFIFQKSPIWRTWQPISRFWRNCWKLSKRLGSDIKNEIIEISAFTDTFYDFRAVLAGLSIYDYFCNENLASLIFSIVPILLFAGVWILIFTKLNRQYKKMKNFIEEFSKTI